MRILLAESEVEDRAALAAILEEDGHEVLGCDNADCALQMLRNGQPFDILLTATEFANMSGFELCWEARLISNSANPLYVIMVSSSRDEAKLVEALDSGADDFINSPPRKSELLARLRAAARLLSAQRELFKLASYDSLTELRNRRSFFEELESCDHLDTPFSIIMLDVDHFKQVNDTHGHEAGDDVLREIGRRAVGIDAGFARLGGEEFGLLVRGALPVAAVIAEKLRKTIASTPFETAAGDLNITASLGVAERDATRDFNKTLKEADVALYAAKSAGRNRVTVSRSMSADDFMLFDIPNVA